VKTSGNEKMASSWRSQQLWRACYAASAASSWLKSAGSTTLAASETAGGEAAMPALCLFKGSQHEDQYAGGSTRLCVAKKRPMLAA